MFQITLTCTNFYRTAVSVYSKLWKCFPVPIPLQNFSLSRGCFKTAVLKLLGAVSWAAVSKPSLNSAFRRRSTFLLHFLCLTLIFRPGDAAVGFFLLTKCQVMAKTLPLAREKRG